MQKMYSEKDANRQALKGKKIVVVGYGSQGKAHALNMRDSGLDVTIGLRKGGKTWAQAEKDGLKVQEVAEACKNADLIAVLTPDMAQPMVFRDSIEPNLKQGAAVLFAHGFNIHFQQITVPAGVDVVMVAPKGPGHLVRRQYEEGRGVPCLVAVQTDASGKAFEKVLAYADAIGGTRAGVLETTFAEETETDLFGEQAVLCGGLTELILAGYETLVDAGYKPEVAYFECLHEVKLIVDLIYEGGIAKMHQFVSDTAKFGDLTRGPRVVDAKVRETMRQILAEIKSGQFAKEWVQENKSGLANYSALLNKDLKHPIEEVGKGLRSRMSWLQQEK